MKKVLGIDIGGMSMKFAVVNENGEVISNVGRFETIREVQEATALKLGRAVKNFLQDEGFDINEITGIGIGCPGTIDSANGVVNYANNLAWEKLALCEIIEKETGLPARVTNDANAAALGEAKFGAAKDYKFSVMLTLGTGVGGGIIIDGNLYEGNKSCAGELGHIVIDNNSPIQCTCGRYGCFEVYASATALIRQTKEAMQADSKSFMWKLVGGDINKVNGKTAFDGKEMGDVTAIKVVDKYIEYLGTGVLNYCNILRPEVIIFSGGIANQGDNLLNPLRKFCEEHVWGYDKTPAVELRIATLGYNSGIIGAASLFL